MEVIRSLQYSFYLMFHPFDGFWDLKHEERGNLKAAIIIIFSLCITYILSRQLTGFLFNNDDPLRLNIFIETGSVILPFLLWCVANWCLTTLMDGEGSFKDIVITTAYALCPLIVIKLILIVLSNVLIIEEGAFYHFLDTASVIWSGGLLLLGTMIVHRYSMTKTLLTSVCIIVGMGVIIFIVLLFINLIREMYSFLNVIFQEITLRL